MALTIQEVLEKRFGTKGFTRRNPEISSIGTTATRLFRNNPNRLAFLLVNLSASAMYALDLAQVSSTNGIRIPPNGGNLFVTVEEDLDWPAAEWYLVGDAGGLSILSIEFVSS